MKTELGIDEAGRGSILGPLVLAGVLVPDHKRDLLEALGISDSKTYGSQQKGKKIREKLAEVITKNFEYEIIISYSKEVDDYVTHQSLNKLEQDIAERIIHKLPADKVILDGENLFKPLVTNNICAFNKADLNYLSVSAASILAKSTRDRLFAEICQPYIFDFGEIKGGGYANQATLKFVKWYMGKKGALPSFYRKSYKWKYLD